MVGIASKKETTQIRLFSFHFESFRDISPSDMRRRWTPALSFSLLIRPWWERHSVSTVIISCDRSHLVRPLPLPCKRLQREWDESCGWVRHHVAPTEWHLTQSTKPLGLAAGSGSTLQLVQNRERFLKVVQVQPRLTSKECLSVLLLWNAKTVNPSNWMVRWDGTMSWLNYAVSTSYCLYALRWLWELYLVSLWAGLVL